MYKIKLFLRLLRASLKRSVKLYIGVLAISLSLLCVVGTAGISLVQSKQSDEGLAKVKVGLVASGEDKFLDMGIGLIETLHESRFSVSLHRLRSENSAQKKLRSRELDAYIIIPKGFANSLMSGENLKLDYVMAKKGAGLSASLTKEVMGVISNYILETQSGVTAACEYAKQLSFTRQEINDIDIGMSERYAGLVVDRDRFVQETVVGLGENLSFAGYYACGLTLFFVMCVGLSCCMLRVKNDFEHSRLLSARGLSPLAQVLAEYISFFLLVTVTMLLCFFGVGIASNYVDISFAEFADYVRRDYFLLGLKLLPSIFVITAMQFLLYECVTGIINAVFLQFLAAVVLGYIGGFFYPSSFFPAGVTAVAKILPTGLSFSWFSSVLVGAPNFAAAGRCVLMGALLLAAACALRRIRIKVLE